MATTIERDILPESLEIDCATLVLLDRPDDDEDDTVGGDSALVPRPKSRKFSQRTFGRQKQTQCRSASYAPGGSTGACPT